MCHYFLYGLALSCLIGTSLTIPTDRSPLLQQLDEDGGRPIADGDTSVGLGGNTIGDSTNDVKTFSSPEQPESISPILVRPDDVLRSPVNVSCTFDDVPSMELEIHPNYGMRLFNASKVINQLSCVPSQCCYTIGSWLWCVDDDYHQPHVHPYSRIVNNIILLTPLLTVTGDITNNHTVPVDCQVLMYTEQPVAPIPKYSSFLFIIANNTNIIKK